MAQESPLVRFGVFEVDRKTGDVRKQGLKIRLRGQPFDVLVLLLERPGDLVTREELREKLWPADTFVDFDHGLNTSVNRLREALGDSADNPRFIETLPRKGYRFIAPVTAAITAAPLTAAPAQHGQMAPPMPGLAGPTVPAQAPHPPGVPLFTTPLPTSVPQTTQVQAKPRLAKRALVVGALLFLAALAVAYRQRGGTPTRTPTTPPRLAVLPFRNLSGDPGQEYLADGLTDTLIADLAQVSALRVISRTSVMLYKASDKRLPDIARELDVDTVVEGSVLRSGDRVRITAQLLDARADRHLWAHSYERDLADILALEGEFARAITREVQVTLTPGEQERLGRTAAVDPRAYEAYLRGRFAWEPMTDEGLRKGVEFMEQALALDPRYTPAWAGMAYCYWLMGSAGYEAARPLEVAEKAKAAVRKALELDPALPAAQATLAMIEIDFDWDFPSGEARLKEVIARNPSFADAHVSYSSYLAGVGRSAEAVEEARRGLELDPLSLVGGQTLGWRLLYAREYDRAVVQFRRTLDTSPRAFVARAGLALALVGQHEPSRALVEAERALADSGGSPWVTALAGHVAAVSGDRDRGRRALADLDTMARRRYVSPVYRAFVHAGLGDRARAVADLEVAFRERSPWMVFLPAEPELDALRSDPGFRDLLRRVGHATGEGSAPARP
jgi:TolB-like protein/DNA-binding winged helix-turn-helix (wHTH) protein